MKLPHIGTVTKEDEDTLVSKPMPIAFLRNHKCSFTLNGYGDDPNPSEIHNALKNILSITDSVLTDAGEFVYQYYEDLAALLAREDYPTPPKINGPADVWNHVGFGDTLCVDRRNDGDPDDGIYFTLECSCDWEQEHGLQIVLRDGLKITKIGPYDGHDTNADAFDDPSLIGVIYKRIK